MGDDEPRELEAAVGFAYPPPVEQRVVHIARDAASLQTAIQGVVDLLAGQGFRLTLAHHSVDLGVQAGYSALLVFERPKEETDD